MSETLKVQLLETIQRVMEQEGISQAEMARRLKGQRYNINKVMRRKASVTIDFLLKMSEAIGLKVELKFSKVDK